MLLEKQKDSKSFGLGGRDEKAVIVIPYIIYEYDGEPGITWKPNCPWRSQIHGVQRPKPILQQSILGLWDLNTTAGAQGHGIEVAENAGLTKILILLSSRRRAERQCFILLSMSLAVLGGSSVFRFSVNRLSICLRFEFVGHCSPRYQYVHGPSSYQQSHCQ